MCHCEDHCASTKTMLHGRAPCTTTRCEPGGVNLAASADSQSSSTMPAKAEQTQRQMGAVRSCTPADPIQTAPATGDCWARAQQPRTCLIIQQSCWKAPDSDEGMLQLHRCAQHTAGGGSCKRQERWPPERRKAHGGSAARPFVQPVWYVGPETAE